MPNGAILDRLDACTVVFIDKGRWLRVRRRSVSERERVLQLRGLAAMASPRIASLARAGSESAAVPRSRQLGDNGNPLILDFG